MLPHLAPGTGLDELRAELLRELAARRPRGAAGDAQVVSRHVSPPR
eukprot:gene42690-53372_t